VAWLRRQGEGSKAVAVARGEIDSLMFIFWQVFRPERFLEGSLEAAMRHQYAYLPFGKLATAGLRLLSGRNKLMAR
jgi:hypothetical protein